MVKDYKKYILVFKNRIRNQTHTYYVNTPKEAIAQLQRMKANGDGFDPKHTHLYERTANIFFKSYLENGVELTLEEILGWGKQDGNESKAR